MSVLECFPSYQTSSLTVFVCLSSAFDVYLISNCSSSSIPCIPTNCSLFTFCPGPILCIGALVTNALPFTCGSPIPSSLLNEADPTESALALLTRLGALEWT